MDSSDHTHARLTVGGLLYGQRVEATWASGHASGDPAMLAVAEAVIAARCTHDHDPSVVAAWDTLPTATVALVRALDHFLYATITTDGVTRLDSADLLDGAV